MNRFGNASELRLPEQVTKALVGKGFALDKLDRPEGCDHRYEVMDRFGVPSKVPIREEVASALFHKGALLGKLDRFQEALTA
jgi:hypothetical protein